MIAYSVYFIVALILIFIIFLTFKTVDRGIKAKKEIKLFQKDDSNNLYKSSAINEEKF